MKSWGTKKEEWTLSQTGERELVTRDIQRPGGWKQALRAGGQSFKGCREGVRWHTLGAQAQEPSSLCKAELFKESCVVSWEQENICPLTQDTLSQAVGLFFRANNTSYSHEWLYTFTRLWWSLFRFGYPCSSLIGKQDSCVSTSQMRILRVREVRQLSVGVEELYPKATFY